MSTLLPILGIAGEINSGKDTVAKAIHAAFEDRVIHSYAFADPVKRACSEIFGIPLHYFYDRELKEKIVPEWGISPRQMMEQIGTDCCRNIIRDDIWIIRGHQWHKKVSSETDHGLCLITDVRYENEADYIEQCGGYVIHVQNPSANSTSEHSSNQGIRVRDNDVVMLNDSTLDSLYFRVHDGFDNRTLTLPDAA